jgi:D-alanine-D-alanine ligase
MDKQMTNIIYTAIGLRVPPYAILDKGQAKSAGIPLPFVVKPVVGGSSIGVSVVKTKKEIPAAFKRALREGRRVMVQKYINGKEVTCGVLEDENGRPFVLPPTEIIPQSAAFFDYHAKYATGGSLEITPARITQVQTKEVQALAVRAHRALGCRGMSRSDFILSGGKFYILETNTIPGMTEASLLPKAAATAGISFPALLDMIIVAGFRK